MSDKLTYEQIEKALEPWAFKNLNAHPYCYEAAHAIEAAATAPLLERIAALERKSDQDDETSLWQAGQISKHIDRIAALERELAEASKDADRLDLVQSMSRVMSLDINGNHYWTTQLRNVRGPNFRAAIDAALTPPEQPK